MAQGRVESQGGPQQGGGQVVAPSGVGHRGSSRLGATARGPVCLRLLQHSRDQRPPPRALHQPASPVQNQGCAQAQHRQEGEAKGAGKHSGAEYSPTCTGSKPGATDLITSSKQQLNKDTGRGGHTGERGRGRGNSDNTHPPATRQAVPEPLYCNIQMPGSRMHQERPRRRSRRERGSVPKGWARAALRRQTLRQSQPRPNRTTRTRRETDVPKGGGWKF